MRSFARDPEDGPGILPPQPLETSGVVRRRVEGRGRPGLWRGERRPPCMMLFFAPCEVTVTFLQSGEPQGDAVLACIYDQIGLHQGRPVYCKRGGAAGEEGFLHYWDNRGSEGDDDVGWWFVPTIMGENAWAYNGGRTDLPPRSGWFFGSIPGRGCSSQSLCELIVECVVQPEPW